MNNTFLKYILRRLLIIPPMLFVLTLLIFAMLSVISPYDRASIYMVGPKSGFNVEGIIKKYGLDDPFHVQYMNWMLGKKDSETGEISGGVLRGEMGFSETGNDYLSDVIAHKFPITAELILWSAIPIIGLSIWMGVKAAANHNKLIDRVLRVTAVSAWSIPSFVTGLFLLMFFYAKLGWFPPNRLSIEFSRIVQSEEFINYTTMNTVDALLNFRFDVFIDALKHLILPVVTLSVSSWAFLLRITRSSMLEVLQLDYVTAARSKGVPEYDVINKHALPNALNPVITIGGGTLIELFYGVMIAEMVFNIPGIGAFMAEAATGLDVVSVAGITLFTSTIVIIGNLVIDVLYSIADPRIRIG